MFYLLFLQLLAIGFPYFGLLLCVLNFYDFGFILSICGIFFSFIVLLISENDTNADLFYIFETFVF